MFTYNLALTLVNLPLACRMDSRIVRILQLSLVNLPTVEIKNDLLSGDHVSIADLIAELPSGEIDNLANEIRMRNAI